MVRQRDFAPPTAAQFARFLDFWLDFLFFLFF